MFHIGSPSEPRHLRIVRVMKDSVELTWDSPASNGGSSITQYVVEEKEPEKEWTPVASVGGSITKCDVIELEDRKNYLFHVYAVNKIGKCSQPCDPVSYYIDIPESMI